MLRGHCKPSTYDLRHRAACEQLESPEMPAGAASDLSKKSAINEA
jgi:hypothetical protein